MEYTMIEIIATGCIPVFDEHWAKHNFRKNGISYYDTPFSGIYSNKEDLESTIDTLYAVSLDEDLQKKYFETSYQIVKEEFDANIVLPEMFLTLPTSISTVKSLVILLITSLGIVTLPNSVPVPVITQPLPLK